MNNKKIDKVKQSSSNSSLNAVTLAADLRDSFIREAKAASMGISRRQYETILRQIGVDYR